MSDLIGQSGRALPHPLPRFYQIKESSVTDRARLYSVPKIMLPVYEKITGLTDNVCDKHLNSEYRDLARAMTAALCRKRRTHSVLANCARGRAVSSMLLEGLIF